MIGELLRDLATHVTWSGGSGRAHAASAIDEGHRLLLAAHDGLVAFEGSLRCFGRTTQALPSLDDWNAPTGWRSEYRDLAAGLQFFAEDVFGNQFASEGTAILRFHAETGEREYMADSTEQWLQSVLSDPDEELGRWLLCEWRRPGNTVGPGEHLCPKQPFVAGGAFEPLNLYALDRHESMAFKAQLAWQTRNLPQGAKIRLKTVE